MPRIDETSASVASGSKITSPQRKKPSWKRLPDENTQYSDWQIDVLFVGNETSASGENVSYLVHRYMVGPPSAYFTVAFDENNGFSESRQRISKIRLPSDRGITSEHFEDLLDFLYDDCSMGNLRFDVDRALAMLYLADYFGIESAKEQTQNFLLLQLKSPTCSGMLLAKVYAMAKFLSMEELQDAVACTKFRQKLKLDEIQSAIATDNSVDNFPLFFPSFLSSLETPELKRECLYRMCKKRKKKLIETNIWSGVVSSCIADDSKLVDKDLFSTMTDKETMPYVETLHAAITILKHENVLDLDQRGEEKLTCLQQRCTRAICSELWKTRSFQLWRLIYATPEDVLKNLQELKPAVLRTIDDNAPSLARPTKKVCTRKALVLKEQ